MGGGTYLLEEGRECWRRNVCVGGGTCVLEEGHARWKRDVCANNVRNQKTTTQSHNCVVQFDSVV